MENLDDVDHFPEECKSPKLTQLKTEHLKRLISIEGIKKVSQGNTLPYAIGPEGFTGEFYQIFKHQIVPMLHKSFQSIENGEKLRDFFYEINIKLYLH